MSILRSILGLESKPEPVKRSTASEVVEAEPAGPVSEALRPLLAFMQGMAESLATERITELTLRDTVTRFVQGRPADGSVKGALIVQPHREGRLVLWAFLDSDGVIVRSDDGSPLGNKAICGALDAELTAMLDGRDLLIVE